MCGRFDLKPLFLGKLRPERLTSYQIVSSEQALPGGTSTSSISLGPNGRGLSAFYTSKIFSMWRFFIRSRRVWVIRNMYFLQETTDL